MNGPQTTARSVAITVVCILGFIGAALSIPLIFSNIARSVGSWYPPYLAFSARVGLTCMIGLWMMRKWAVFVYTALVIVGQVVLISMGLWNIIGLLIPAIVIAIGVVNLPKMR